MGGKSAKGGKKKGGAKAADDDEDALLDAAIAQTQAQMQQMELEKQEAETKRKAQLRSNIEAKVKAERAARSRDEAAKPLSCQEICDKMDSLPVFCIVNEKKGFVLTQLPEEEEPYVVFWTEPDEIKAAIKRAQKQRPDATFAMGTIPLGRAFALCEGWAEAGGQTNFRLQPHAKVAQEFRPMLTNQLEQMGLSTKHVFPVFTCEELTTDTVMPFFLSRAEMVSTWEELMRQRGVQAPPPSQMNVLDLRFLSKRMQSSGVDWSIVKFVGMERAYEAVRDAQAQETEKALAAQAAAERANDPDAEPPPLAVS